MPCPTWHRIDVSDDYSVASHPVCPSRARHVYAIFPMPVPCTVTHVDPRGSRFTPCMALKPGTSADHACVTLPDCPPAVTTARLDPCTPCPTWHRIDVSDAHSVASHPVCSFRACPVMPSFPCQPLAPSLKPVPLCGRFLHCLLTHT